MPQGNLENFFSYQTRGIRLVEGLGRHFHPLPLRLVSGQTLYLRSQNVWTKIPLFNHLACTGSRIGKSVRTLVATDPFIDRDDDGRYLPGCDFEDARAGARNYNRGRTSSHALSKHV